MKSAKWKLILLVVQSLLFAALPTQAVPLYSVQASANATSNGVGISENSGVLVGATATTASATSSAVPGSHEAIASASVQQGTLSAGAKASSSSNMISGSSASALAAFVDTLTLVGPAGFADPVSLLFSLNVSGFFAGCGSCPAQANASSTLTVVDPAGNFADNRPSAQFSQLFLGGLDNLTSATIPLTVLLTTGINSEISLRGNLDVSAGAQGLASFAETNFLSTAHYYVDVLTAGVSLVSASGKSYARQSTEGLPEPTVLWLIVSGIMFLLFVRKRTEDAS